MMRGAAAILATLALAGAAPAAAQEPADPIDALLRQSAPAAPDPNEPDTAAEGTTTVAPDAIAPTPDVAARAAPARPGALGPVFVEQTGRSNDAPPTGADLAYDSRIKASMAAAQSFQGPLDGGWTLSGPGGDLYAFELADKDGAIEGSWRDLRHPGGISASGFVERVEAGDGELTVRFGGRVAVLRAEEGRWRGRLTEDGRTEAVSLRRKP